MGSRPPIFDDLVGFLLDQIGQHHAGYSIVRKKTNIWPLARKWCAVAVIVRGFDNDVWRCGRQFHIAPLCVRNRPTAQVSAFAFYGIGCPCYHWLGRVPVPQH